MYNLVSFHFINLPAYLDLHAKRKIKEIILKKIIKNIYLCLFVVVAKTQVTKHGKGFMDLEKKTKIPLIVLQLLLHFHFLKKIRQISLSKSVYAVSNVNIGCTVVNLNCIFIEKKQTIIIFVVRKFLLIIKYCIICYKILKIRQKLQQNNL